MNIKKQKNGLETLKKQPNIVYVFEYLGSSRSSLDDYGASKNYIQLSTFYSLKTVEQSLNKSEINVLFFNLANIIVLKLHQYESKIFLYFINSYANKRSNLNELKIERIEFDSLDQIHPDVFNRLKESFILLSDFRSAHQEAICLKNIFITKQAYQSMGSNLFSSVCLANRSDIGRNDLIGNLADDGTDNLFDVKILNALVKDVLDENVQQLKKFDFIQLNGRVINIAEDDCCFDFYCSDCKNNEILKSSGNNQENDITQQKLIFNPEKKLISFFTILNY